MGILGIGVDVLHVPRIAALVQRKSATRLASRILSPPELVTWNSIPAADVTRRLRFLSVRWSIKEAAYKAMYPTTRPTWKELTFLDNPTTMHGQKPVLQYLPKHAAKSVGSVHSSISHDGEYIFATVLVETSSGI
ncbi:4'-phosphopantetheinyl transferase [Daedalea quercina L-15889]|uniref:4'-phosphopantetheinyl transferase n=1 Tax=Daedalea quercina L-15889 TaxID=1314783 RepID=A0A165SXY3_9APHY|nr:4'-phosphopantetheinyl transferase [Daedalea quercina L-15889]